MDKNHTVKEHLNKVDSLIAAVHMLFEASPELNCDALKFQIESLNVLANETSNSLDEVRTICNAGK